MNYYQPQQRYTKDKKPSGIWDYCCSNKRTGTYPVGYCAGWHEQTLEEFEKKFPGHGEEFFEDQERRRTFKDRYHKDGHRSEAEAIACYRRYELDLHVRVGSTGENHRPCLVCRVLTSRTVIVHQTRVFHVCEKHNDREVLEKHYQGGTSFGSM